jgi:uncharacterized protein (DUF58 family)
MESRTNEPRLTSLLSNELLHRVERLRINSLLRKTSRMRGEHLSGRGGTSTEFSDYRDYADGDDLRYVDWNIFSRLHRPYLKLYHLEEEQHVVVLVDGSNSMMIEGKFELAKTLAASFGLMGLMGGERVSVYGFTEPDKEPASLPPTSGRPSRHKLLRFVETLKASGKAPIERGVDLILKAHRGKGVVILLSDFLTFGDIRKAFNSLSGAGLEVLALQILAPIELDPELTGDLRLIDSESDDMLDVTSASSLLSIYHQYKTAFQRNIENLAQQRGGRYLCVSSAEPPGTIILDTLRRKGWVR